MNGFKIRQKKMLQDISFVMLQVIYILKFARSQYHNIKKIWRCVICYCSLTTISEKPIVVLNWHPVFYVFLNLSSKMAGFTKIWIYFLLWRTLWRTHFLKLYSFWNIRRVVCCFIHVNFYICYDAIGMILKHRSWIFFEFPCSMWHEHTFQFAFNLREHMRYIAYLN